MTNRIIDVNDDVLVTRIRQNDKDAFKLLYNRYSKKIYYFSLKYLGNKIEVEELVQSVFINVWENRKSLDPTYSVKSYIYKAAVNYIYNYLKKKSIHARFVESQINNDEIHLNLKYEQVFFNDLEKSINSIVGTLPPQQQKIFRLNRDEGLTYMEIASKLDISVRTVENQMYRALKTLRTILKEKYL
ncbi:MAG: RNA polymerase sigma-70 factor [Ignavibacteriales bacterium]|nr:MAG: RNA polymerase sigma-70 factor [Ignavibacteriales bacterium]RPI76522.1 MAG: RNA polymerase sigma-70 factor [Ignavibacteriales bacterium]